MAIGAIEPTFLAELITKLEVAVDLDRQHDCPYWPAQKAVLEKRIAERTRDLWDEIFTRSDACATPVLNWMEARSHPDTSSALEAGDPRPAITFHGS